MKEGGGGGDDGDGNGGGEAARGRTITEQAASVLWRLRARRATMGSGDGGGVDIFVQKIATWTFTEEAAPNQSGSSL